MNTLVRALLNTVIAFVILAAGIFAAATIILSWNYPFDDEPFSQTDWHAASADLRARMADDLMKNHIPKEMTKMDLFVLLGDPDEITQINDTNEKLGYHIGCWSGYAEGSTFIYFTVSDGTVVDSKLGGY